MQNLLIIFTVLILTCLIVLLGIGILAWSAKKALIRQENVWSAKGIPFRRKKFRDGDQKTSKNNKLLEEISSITNDYLEEEGKEKS